MVYNKTGRAVVSATWPRAFAVCDRCGFLYNHRDLTWQLEWAGPRLQNLRILVCEECLDKPQDQLRTILIPADPIPIDTPRQEPYINEIGLYPSQITPGPYDDLTNQSTAPTPTPDPPDEMDPTPLNATATPPSSYFSVIPSSALGPAP